MRISTGMLYETAGARISDLTSSLAKTQSQIASNLRVQTPSDDPVAAARAIEVSQALAVNTQQAVNRNTAKTSLQDVESHLATVDDLLADAKSQLIAAGNGALDDQQRGFIATDLKSRLDELLGIANSRDGSGNYLFSGYQTTTKPYALTATGAAYGGDQGQRLIQVSPSRQMAISEPGQAIFSGGGQDIFSALTTVINLLNTPGSTGATRTAGLDAANLAFEKASDNASTVRASVGSRLRELDTLDNAGQAIDAQYQGTLSNLQDLDYAKAITKLSQQQVTLEAAQKSFVAITSLSLFDFVLR